MPFLSEQERESLRAALLQAIAEAQRARLVPEVRAGDGWSALPALFRAAQTGDTLARLVLADWVDEQASDDATAAATMLRLNAPGFYDVRGAFPDPETRHDFTERARRFWSSFASQNLYRDFPWRRIVGIAHDGMPIVPIDVVACGSPRPGAARAMRVAHHRAAGRGPRPRDTAAKTIRGLLHQS